MLWERGCIRWYLMRLTHTLFFWGFIFYMHEMLSWHDHYTFLTNSYCITNHGFSWESMSKSSSLCCWTMQSEWSLRLFSHTYGLQNGCAWELVITWYVHPVRTEQAVIMSCQCMNMCPATYFPNPTNISRYTTSKLCLVG